MCYPYEALTALFTKPPASQFLGFAWYNSCGMEKCPLAVNGAAGRNGLWRSFCTAACNPEAL